MIIDSKSGIRGVLVDADTSQRIAFARWANLETGEYEALATTPDGRTVLRPVQIKSGRARLKWIPAAGRQGAGKLIVPDDGLPERRGKRIVMIPGQECEARGCHRLAEYGVADEQELEAATTPDGKKWQRAETARVHLFCAQHYRNPVFTSLRGVQSEVPITYARPQ